MPDGNTNMVPFRVEGLGFRVQSRIFIVHYTGNVGNSSGGHPERAEQYLGRGAGCARRA